MAAPLENLREILLKAAQPVTLSASLIQAAEGVPPPHFDSSLRAAYRLPTTAAGLTVEFLAADVGPIVERSFPIEHARLSFLGYDSSKSDVKLRFREGESAVEVAIEVVLEGWSWSTTFPMMIEWPFDQLSYATPTFLFTTEPILWSWRGGGEVSVQAGQNFVGTLTVPEVYDPIFSLVGVTPPPTCTVLGSVRLDRVTIVEEGLGEEALFEEPEEPEESMILYPDVALWASLAASRVELFVLEASSPAIGLLIETIEEHEEGKVVYQQTPSLLFAAKHKATEKLTLDLGARVTAEGTGVTFSLRVDPESETWLSPAEAIALLAGTNDGGSFLDGVPTPLQQFLANVGLEGLALSGGLPPKGGLDSIGIVLANKPGTELTLFRDPVTGQEFAVERFAVEWMVLIPLELEALRQLVRVSASFRLWEKVFDKALFTVSIDQDMRIEGALEGTVSFGKLLEGISGETLRLPEKVEASLSEITVQIDPTAHSYAVGATLDAAFSFVEFDGRPLILIEDMALALAAVTSSDAGKTTTYTGSLAGVIAVGPVVAALGARYDGAATPAVWSLHAELMQPLELGKLVAQFFQPSSEPYTYPKFIQADLSIDQFTLDATVPVKGEASYSVSGALSWTVPLVDLPMRAEAGLQYDPTRGTGQEFSGSVVGTVEVPSLGTEVQVGYRFGPTAQDAIDLGRPQLAAAAGAGDSKVLWVAWEGIRGQYELDKEELELSLAGWSAGRVIQALVRTIGDPYFELESPWDFLNQISLDGLKLYICFKADAPQRFRAEYTLSRPIELGFLTINGLDFRRGADGKVTLALDASTTIESLAKSPLLDPEKGQSVEELPSVAGQGSSYFELLLLVLGQRVGIRAAKLDSTKAVIEELQKAPPTTGAENPVDPSGENANEPFYDPTRGWLFAAHFGVLQVGPVYTLDCMVVFNDPDLYGLRLAFNGEKAKVLDGLVLDVLYKKVSDDVGVYELEFTFPKALRTIDLGSFSITLPTIGLQIYTNGDFLIDFGFPYNLDFSRSFGLQAIVPPGVPVLGAAGFYFGRLPAGAVEGLPQSTPEHKLIGTFSTATAFGLGIQFGVGRYFEKGPLSAGFSITVFGIVEGLIAPWHAPDEPAHPPRPLPPAAASGAPLAAALLLSSGAGGGALQQDYFFRLKGSFGLIGKLYGSVNFAIVKAEVNLTVTFEVTILYESYRDIQLSASASVSVSVSIKINLGLFSISISFSFSATISVDLTIETGEHDPPWYHEGRELSGARRAALPQPRAPARPKSVVGSQRPTLHLHPAPQFTVLSPDGVTLAQEQGAFVFLLATDAPTADGHGNRAGSSFELLCERLFAWVIDALAEPHGAEVDLSAVAAVSVSRQQLQEYVSALAAAPIPESEIESKLLSQAFEVVIEPASEARRGQLQEGATIFPVFSGLTLTVPAADGSGRQVTIALSDYVKVTAEYRRELAKLFAELAARVEQESGGQSVHNATGAQEAGEPLAQFLFEDWFAIVAQQLLQAGADAIGDYAYQLRAGDTIGSIVQWAVQAGNAVTPLDVLAPNLTHPLNEAKQLRIEGLTYTVQRADSLERIARRYSDPAAQPRWSLTPRALVEANAEIKGLLAGGVEVSFGSTSHTTGPGESFASLAEALRTTVAQLAADSALYGRADLLAAAALADIPPIAYLTASGDTVKQVLERFDLSLEALCAVPANLAEADLLAAGAIRVAGLERVTVAEVWQAIAATDQVAQVAGMVARFQLHGLRLPRRAGLELPPNFLYPADQQEWGVHQLSGQQFPTPPLSPTPSYSIQLGKEAGLDWLTLDVSTLALDEQARQLYYVLEYARQGAYDPHPALAAEPATSAEPKRYAAQSRTPLASSDLAGLEKTTAPPSAGAQTGAPGEGPQQEAIVWDLPPALTRRVQQRYAALSAHFDAAVALPYMPVVQPQLAVSDPASGHTAYTPVERFALATRIQIEVKRLAQGDDLPPQRPDANGVIPPGPGNSGAPSTLAPYAYELIGPRPADAVLLEQLLGAMDSLGPQIVAQLLLAYPTSGPGAAGLTSRADHEFLSFITQTNLSTETKPPAGMARATLRAQAPHGIANEPAQFIKLLWELSTVRSGGYYLYYELLEEQAGLPDALFDSSGVATLTLLIAYSRTATGTSAARLSSCANALITTEAIDAARAAMTFQSCSSPAESQPLAGAPTLAAASELYGTDVGRLASLNAQAQLATGGEIPLAGVVHQLSAADMESADSLASVAAYYSAGAQTPISRAQLAAFNPRVEPRLGAALRIPPLTYVVSEPPAAPGNTFASLSAYYGLSYDALGHAAAQTAGLFGAAARIAVDGEERTAHPTVGEGNAAVALTRPAPPDPCPQLPGPKSPPCPPLEATPEQLKAFASAYMQTLYTILSASVRESAFFDASPPGLPSGPRKSLSAEEAQALRAPAARRDALATAASEPLEYVPTLGFGRFCKANAAPPGDSEGPLPPRAANPYAGVGVPIQMHLRWLDLFGNQIVSALGSPPSGYYGPLNDPPVPIGYSDRIVGLGQWPNVYAHHEYAGAAGAPALKVTLQLRVDAYEPAQEGWQQAAANDLKTWTRVYFQLNQEYDALAIPGLSGQAISISLLNTLLATPEVPLSEPDATALREFVSACLTYVWRRAHDEDCGEVPTLLLTLPIALADLSTEDVLPMSLSLKLTRQSELCDPALRAVAGGLSDVTEILPLTGKNPDEPNVSLARFATLAEAALQCPDWQLRVGTSAATPGDEEAQPLWAVRMARTPGSGLGYEVQPGASFYAPAPPARTLYAGAATIGRYTTGKPFPDQTDTLKFAGADLNAWANQTLAAIDAFLSPGYANPAFLADQLLVEEPEVNGRLQRILEHKRTLAGAIARTVKPILASSADDEKSVAAAEAKLEQALLDQLSFAATVTAVTVFSVADAKTGAPLPPDAAAPPRFYGQPLGTPAVVEDDEGGEPNFALSSAKIPLTRADRDGDSRLAFLFTSKNALVRSYQSLALEYAVSHLEHEITAVPGIERYEQSQWIKFVNGPFKTPLQPREATGAAPAPVELPVVLRALPQPPTLTEQTAQPTNREARGRPTVAPGATPEQLAQWDYAFSYLYPAAAQDEVSVTVQFNHGPGLDAEEDPTAGLFAALAQFVTVQPAIEADLTTYLRPIDGASKADDPAVLNAGAALAALEQIVAAVATAYDRWSRQLRRARAAAEDVAPVTYEFDVALGEQQGRALVEIYSEDLTLPRPLVDIDPERWEAVPVKEPRKPALYAYEYRARSGPEAWLSYEDARVAPARTVAYAGNDVFARQDGHVTIQVVRNTRLVPGEDTAEAFLFSTPEVKPASRIVPLLAYSEYALDPLAPEGSTLETFLERFFASLLSNAAEETVAVKLASGYRFALVPAIAAIAPTLLPIHLLAPTLAPDAHGSAFVPAVGDAVERWLSENPRPGVTGTQLSFALEVFASNDPSQQKPLLTIRDLHVDMAKLVAAVASA